MGKNLALKYSKKVDERFYKQSQAMLALNNDYEFNGVETVKVFSIPTVAMNDYKRTGSNRYGEPNDLTRNVQTLTVTKDRSATWIIDRGDKIQSQMVMDAGKSLSRQMREVVIPEYDTYVFNKLASVATAKGNFASTAVTKSNAYEMFLNGQEKLGNANVPDQGRVCFCSYRFANLLKQDPAFMRYSNMSQEMLIKGIMGEVDGVKIVKVPSSRLPVGAAFLLTHPIAATAPKQLSDFKIHDNPPGINGWLVELREIYDCFVLNEKANAIYYHGSQPVLQQLNILTASGETTGHSTLLVQPDAPAKGHTRFYQMKPAASGLTKVTAGQKVTTESDGWVSLPANGADMTVSSNKVVAVVELDGSKQAVSYGIADINAG